MRWLKQDPKATASEKATAKAKAKRRRARARFDRRAVRRGGLALSIAAAVGLLWQSGWFSRQVEMAANGLLDATAHAGLAVDDVLVEGRAFTSAASILAALDVERGAPILTVDPRAARERLERLPWVGEASVERRLPALLYVRLSERRPLALWQLGGELSVIDDEGAAIAGAKVEDFLHLPLVVGPDAANHASDLLRVIESEPALRPLVIAATRIGGRRWSVQLEGGVAVHLPEGRTAGAWSKFAEIEREHGVLDQDDVKVIDLRLPDRLIVTTTPEDDSGEET